VSPIADHFTYPSLIAAASSVTDARQNARCFSLAESLGRSGLSTLERMRSLNIAVAVLLASGCPGDFARIIGRTMRPQQHQQQEREHRRSSEA
jgi:hypothetical protein